MKKALLSILGIVLVMATAIACTATGGLVQQTPAQVAAQVCPPVNSGIDALQSMQASLSATAQKDLTTAEPIVTAVCAAGATVTSTSLRALAKTALPAISTIVQATNLPNKNDVVLALGIAQGVLNAVIQNLPAQTAVPASAASGV